MNNTRHKHRAGCRCPRCRRAGSVSLAHQYGRNTPVQLQREIAPDSRAHVQWLQRSLNSALELSLPEDGELNPSTRSALRSFQKRKGLKPDGILNLRTERYLMARGGSPHRHPVGTDSEWHDFGGAAGSMTWSSAYDPIDQEVSMIVLSDSVGNGGANRSYDVYAVQNLLNKFISAGKLPGISPLAVDGKSGSKTISAIRVFQKAYLGMNNPDGRVDAGGKTLQALNGPVDQPLVTPAGGPSSSTCRGPLSDVRTSLARYGLGYCSRTGRRYGIPETIQAINHVAVEWFVRHPGGPSIVVHDVSQCGGGRIPPHSSHRAGLDVDLSLRANHQPDRCNSGTRTATGEGKHRKSKDYDTVWRPLYKELVQLFDSNPYLPVKIIWYQDSELKKLLRRSNGTYLVSTSESGHDRHMHIRFCMPERVKSSLALGKVYGPGVKRASYKCS